MSILKVVVLLCSAANADVCLPPFEELVEASNPALCALHSPTSIVRALEEHPGYVLRRISCERPRSLARD